MSGTPAASRADADADDAQPDGVHQGEAGIRRKRGEFSSRPTFTLYQAMKKARAMEMSMGSSACQALSTSTRLLLLAMAWMDTLARA